MATTQDDFTPKKTQDDAGLSFDQAISLVTQFRSSKCWLSLSPSDSSLWLSQLKSMATQEGLFFDHAVSIVTQFRASKYRLSLSPSPSDSAMKHLGSPPNSRKGLRGGLRADIARTSSATKSTGNLDKSKGLSLAVDANSNVAGQHNRAASSRKATMRAAKSMDVGSSKSRFENPMLKHVYETLNMAV
ncbi:hypothetical protein RHGRI_018932 [Rhododendron griersonianum]|uniref:Uncharacterized protein n=1 Tax=Rhododendron griersonianum TaxID=479676 RepID=A0AAV6JEW6_9ERIC|nr:hypothetical protein RHGRI_018932 [Rhododendron griersonianum]